MWKYFIPRVLYEWKVDPRVCIRFTVRRMIRDYLNEIRCFASWCWHQHQQEELTSLTRNIRHSFTPVIGGVVLYYCKVTLESSCWICQPILPSRTNRRTSVFSSPARLLLRRWSQNTSNKHPELIVWRRLPRTECNLQWQPSLLKSKTLYAALSMPSFIPCSPFQHRLFVVQYRGQNVECVIPTWMSSRNTLSGPSCEATCLGHILEYSWKISEKF